jgi:hypothetical protein
LAESDRAADSSNNQEGDAMVSILCFIAGFYVGFFVASLMAAAARATPAWEVVAGQQKPRRRLAPVPGQATGNSTRAWKRTT